MAPLFLTLVLPVWAAGLLAAIAGARLMMEHVRVRLDRK